jgi:DNA-binding MarR family transcriptional regulator
MPPVAAHFPKADRHVVIAEIVRSLHNLFQTVDSFSKFTLRRYGVTGPQIWALRNIAAHDKVAVGELAESMYLHISTVSGVIDRLEGQELVTRERNDDDRRVVHLRITPRGMDILQKAPEAPRSKLLVGVQRLPDSDLMAMHRSVRQLTRILGDVTTKDKAHPESPVATRLKS